VIRHWKTVIAPTRETAGLAPGPPFWFSAELIGEPGVTENTANNQQVGNRPGLSFRPVRNNFMIPPFREVTIRALEDPNLRLPEPM
jgi:hypothetical protein